MLNTWQHSALQCEKFVLAAVIQKSEFSRQRNSLECGRNLSMKITVVWWGKENCNKNLLTWMYLKDRDN
jgi:hypothetical protein